MVCCTLLATDPLDARISTTTRTLPALSVTRMSDASTPDSMAASDALKAFSLKDETSPATVISVRTRCTTRAPGVTGGSGGCDGGGGGGGGAGGDGGGEGGGGTLAPYTSTSARERYRVWPLAG